MMMIEVLEPKKCQKPIIIYNIIVFFKKIDYFCHHKSKNSS